jgi:hypothetical protein
MKYLSEGKYKIEITVTQKCSDLVYLTLNELTTLNSFRLSTAR